MQAYFLIRLQSVGRDALVCRQQQGQVIAGKWLIEKLFYRRVVMHPAQVNIIDR